MESKTVAEAILTEVAFRLAGKPNPTPELEFLSSDVRGSNGWRLVIWCRWLPERDKGDTIHTLVLHEKSEVEVWPDAPTPQVLR